MLEAFLACSGAVFERGNWALGFGRADVVLRCRVGRALSWVLATLFGNAGRTFSRGADVLDFVSCSKITQMRNLKPLAGCALVCTMRVSPP